MALSIVRVRIFWASNIFVIIVFPYTLDTGAVTGTEPGVEFYTLALTGINIAAFQPFNTYVVSTRLVSTKQSPNSKAFYKQYPVKITLDTGAEISMIKASVAKHIGTVIKKAKQSALHADGITPLVIVGETHIMLSRDNIELASDA